MNNAVSSHTDRPRSTGRLPRGLEIGTGLLLLLIFAGTAIKALGRNFLELPLLALADLIPVLGFVFLVSALALATIERVHVVIQLLSQIAPPVWCRRIERAADAFAALFLLGAGAGLALFTVDAVRYAESTEATSIPLWPALAAAICVTLASAIGMAWWAVRRRSDSEDD